jgi:hypothetical protein
MNGPATDDGGNGVARLHVSRFTFGSGYLLETLLGRVKLEGMEEVLPPETENGAGFEPTRLRQFTVFLDNRVGRLQTLVRALEDVSRIVALSIEESGDAALIRLICSEPDRAREALADAAFSFNESEVLAVVPPRRSRQPLTAVCAALLAAEINIHYAYPLLTPPKGPAIALYVEDPTLAAQLLIRKGFDLLGESDFRRRPEENGQE